MRVGIGYDVHKLVAERALILGGLSIPYEKGLLGHSDADVLTHAIMDAMLGALGKGDIGKHFPDNDPQYKGISSLSLLNEVVKLMQEEHYVIGNIDAIIIAQAPKLGGFFDEMRENLAKVLCCNPDVINLKATTTEKLGFEGRGEGIASQVIVLLNNE